ncbi:hypothetical protein EV182_002016, partial [Spiromyces aspiralis]
LYSPELRAMAINVYAECLEIICMALPAEPGAEVPHQFAQAVTDWVDVIFGILKQPITLGPGSSIVLKIEAAKVVVLFLQGFNEITKPLTKPLLEIVWSELKWILPRYERAHVRGDPVDMPLEYINKDGEETSIDSYIFTLLDILSRLCRKKLLRDIFVSTESIQGQQHTGNGADADSAKKSKHLRPTQFLVELVCLLISYCQITTEMSDLWERDIDLYIADEDEEGFSFNVRVASQEVLESIEAAFGNSGRQAIVDASVRCFDQCQAARQQDPTNWWKLAEAALLVLGNFAESISELAAAHPGLVQLSMPALLEDILKPLSEVGTAPFGQGRVFVFASQFSGEFPPDVAVSIMEAAGRTCKDNAAHPVARVSALRACGNFCRHLDNALIERFIPDIVEGSTTLLPQLSEDSLHVALNAFYHAIKTSVDVTARLESFIGPLVLDIWQKFRADAWITNIISDIFEVLASNPKANTAFQQRALPVIGNAIFGDEDGDESVGFAIDLLTSLIQGSPSPLPSGYVQTIFPPLIRLLMSTKGHDVLQNGELCLKKLVEKDAAQIAEWHDEAGASGIDYIIQFITVLLQPDASESVALFMGDLVCKLVQRGSQYIAGDTLVGLIDIITARLATARTSTFIASLLPFYGQIAASHPRELVNALANWSTATVKRPGEENLPDCRVSGLELIIPIMCDHFNDIHGYYNTKVSTVALCKLYELEDPRIYNILVKENPMVRGVSKQQQQPVLIPARVRIARLILSEIVNDIETLYSKRIAGRPFAEDGPIGDFIASLNRSRLAGESDEDSEFDDDDEDSDEFKGLENQINLLSEALDNPRHFFENSDEFDDEENDEEMLQNDEIYKTDMRNYLVEFVRHCLEARIGKFGDSEMLGYLGDDEKALLQRVSQMSE